MHSKDGLAGPTAESIGREAGGRAAIRPSQGLVLQTARLVLRPPAVTDAPALAEQADNAGVARMLVGMPHPYRIADALDWIGEAAPEDGQKHVIALGDGDRPGALIGAATLDFRRGARLPTLGLWLGEGHWGQGYAVEAAHAVIDYAFLHQGHERISFTCRVTNPAGRRVIEKCGFQFATQELAPSMAARVVVPVDRFTLDRGVWESLRRWAPLRVGGTGSTAA